ncbi:MAG: hypothetical protein JXR44_03175 [Thiotrichales bacterium]|nr:hypothetical protein [Thiotrichales bacterium]
MPVCQPNFPPPKTQYLLGIDLGTSGLRAVVVQRESTPCDLPVENKERILAQSQVALKATDQDPRAQWQSKLQSLLEALGTQVDLHQVDGLIADATSSSLWLSDLQGNPLTPVLMYHSQVATQQAQAIAEFIVQWQKKQPQPLSITTAALGVSSSLAKAWYLYQQLPAYSQNQPLQLVHQIDWLNDQFVGFLGTGENMSDENNLLKFGYDPALGDYPPWLRAFLAQEMPFLQLPKVGRVGQPFAQIAHQAAQRFGLKKTCQVCYGTTDSLAAFFAAGASQLGDAVSSLGSSIAIKLLASRPVFAPEFGLYSHRIGAYWLVGGASNSGGQVLLKYYDIAQVEYLDTLSIELINLNASLEQSLPQAAQAIRQSLQQLGDYYPLLSSGERFPFADPNLAPRLAAVPDCPLPQCMTQPDALKSVNAIQQMDAEQLTAVAAHLLFYSSIVQGFVQVELAAYQRLTELGCRRSQLFAVGGGTRNRYWQRLRQNYLHRPENPLKSPFSSDAAFGVTRLARLDSVLLSKPFKETSMKAPGTL